MKNNHFICPICKTPLTLSEDLRSLVCAKEMKPHCFDISSAGYVNLDRGHSGGGDSKECVKSRSAFLNKGHYAPISEKICSIANSLLSSDCVLLDAGCGEGYYTSALSRALPDTKVYGIDISKVAIEQGAKRAKKERLSNNLYAVSSVFEIPFADKSIDCITSIFAPCPEKEFDRVLKNGGYLIIAAAGKKHLLGLKKVLYDTVYMNEERADLPSDSDFEFIDKITLSYNMHLVDKEEILNLFSMTPYYYRTSQKDKDKLLTLESLDSEVEIDFLIYRKI